MEGLLSNDPGTFLGSLLVAVAVIAMQDNIWVRLVVFAGIVAYCLVSYFFPGVMGIISFTFCVLIFIYILVQILFRKQLYAADFPLKKRLFGEHSLVSAATLKEVKMADKIYYLVIFLSCLGLIVYVTAFSSSILAIK